MPNYRLLGIALALSICGAAGAPRAEASKVSIGEQSIRKELPSQPADPEKSETAVVPRELEAQPLLKAPQTPIKYDALPEHDRKARTVEEILGTVAEV